MNAYPNCAPAGSLPPTVLVVDDNEDTANQLAHLLQLMGYATLIAYDGDAGVEMALQRRPQVAIFDLHMPRMGGLAACSRLREALAGDPMTIVALTGSTQQSDREGAELAGFDHFLIKPVMVGALIQVLPPTDPAG